MTKNKTNKKTPMETSHTILITHWTLTLSFITFKVYITLIYDNTNHTHWTLRLSFKVYITLIYDNTNHTYWTLRLNSKS